MPNDLGPRTNYEDYLVGLTGQLATAIFHARYKVAGRMPAPRFAFAYGNYDIVSGLLRRVRVRDTTVITARIITMQIAAKRNRFDGCGAAMESSEELNGEQVCV